MTPSACIKVDVNLYTMPIWSKIVVILMMETAGVEPASKRSATQASTRVDCLFTVRVTLCQQSGRPERYSDSSLLRTSEGSLERIPLLSESSEFYMGDRKARQLTSLRCES